MSLCFRIESVSKFSISAWVGLMCFLLRESLSVVFFWMFVWLTMCLQCTRILISICSWDMVAIIRRAMGGIIGFQEAGKEGMFVNGGVCRRRCVRPRDCVGL